MLKSDASGYEKNWGWVGRFSGFLRKGRYEVARTKKVPRYIKLGRTVRDVPSRTFEGEFREK